MRKTKHKTKELKEAEEREKTLFKSTIGQWRSERLIK